MYFLLDKDYAIGNIVRCIGVSDKPFTDDEIKVAKETYNTKETIVFIGDDIPHHIEFNQALNTIVEKLPVEEIETLSVQDEVVEEPKVFNEDVEVEAGVFYFYIDKNIADTEYRTETIATFTKPLLNPKEYLQKEVYEVKGTDIPFYITIDNGKIRESTKYEQYLRGQYKLQEREIAFKEEIIYLEEGWYIENNELIKVERPDDMVKPVFNEKAHIWEETASDDEITEYIGKNITKLLYEVLSIGCEVTINGEKHQQSLADEKRKALNERISGFKLAEELGSPITHVAWPFKDDGTDTVVMTTDEFKQMSLYCLNYGDKCYIAAELLKAKRNINTTLEDFYSELEHIDDIKIENL